MHEFIALSLFNAPLAKVVEAARDVLRQRYWSQSCELFPLPNQESTHRLQATLWAPVAVPDRTAFMGHVSDGWYTLTNVLARQMKVEVLSFRATPPNAERYVCGFRYWVRGDEVRSVHALDDSPWSFFQRGDVLSVENPEMYRKRRIKDRVTAAYLAKLADSLGWPVATDAFWQSEGSAMLLRSVAG